MGNTRYIENQARLIRSVDVANGHVVEIQTQAWGDYWEGWGLFDDNVFVLPSGRSLIGQLMEVADRIVIEDEDLRAPHLRRHIDEFGLSTLRVTDMSDRQRMRGASLTLVDKRS